MQTINEGSFLANEAKLGYTEHVESDEFYVLFLIINYDRHARSYRFQRI